MATYSDKQIWVRQQKECEAEQARREKLHKARVATFGRIIEEAPVSFNQAQERVPSLA
jgi:ParB family chromosome partitioning protein